MTVKGPLCHGCPHEEKGEIFVPFDGSGLNKVLLVGDSAWQYEARTFRTVNGENVGTPFSGPSGWFMDRQFKRLGVKRGDFLIANSAWCKAPALGQFDHPEKHPEAAMALEHCRPYLDDLIERMKPSVIVPMGNVALRRITGLTGIEKHNAYVLPTAYGIPAIPTFHPSFILQGNQKLAGLWCFAVRRALNISKGTEKAQEYRLLLDPPVLEAEGYFSYPSSLLVCDIETSGSEQVDEEEAVELPGEIVRISFSNRAGTAISMPWSPPYIELAKRVLAEAREVVFWNQAFDVPRLRQAGCSITGRITDAMWAWHWLQSDLLKGLGFVAPLLIPLEPWKHTSQDTPARYSALDSAITMDCFLEIKRQLEEQGRWEAFERHCTRVIPHLEGMSEHGMMIDCVEQDKLKTALENEQERLAKAIDKAVPDTVKTVKIYKKKPSVTLPFNPASPLQVKKLIQHFKLPVPKGKGGDTTDVKHLKKLARKQPIFGDILSFREHSKLTSSYMWEPASDGRIHPQFGFWPSTWRKAARNPNIQTIPKRNELAKLIRRTLIAAPGNLLVECDSSGIEAVLVGYFANSPAYIELARRGVHKWLATEFAGRPVSKEEPLYDKIKRVVHLSNYMGTPQRIAEEYPDDFDTVREANELQEFYFSQPAGRDVRKWQESTLQQAHKEHFLDTPFQQRHYFYNVFAWRNGKWALGEDAKRAVAFRPQASASAIQDEYLLAMVPEFSSHIVAVVHDAFIAEVPEGEAEQFARTLKATMEQPIAALGGLWIGAECKIGPNLAEMEVVK